MEVLLMLSLEDYISKRKKEDNMNEFDPKLRMENMKISVNYVFEYFNQYFETQDVVEQMVLNNERLEKFQKQVRQFNPDIQDWLVNIYDNHDKHIHRSITHHLKKNELFLLFHTENEFREASYDCYAEVVKKNPYLKGQTEMLFLLIKDYHRILSERSSEIDSLYISEEINDWVLKTWLKYRVNLFEFASDWTCRFSDNLDLWPEKHKIKSDDRYDGYVYDVRRKNNLFNMNFFYRKVSNKPFLKGKKQYLEILLMYYWLNQIDDTDEDYWSEYIKKVLT